MQLKFSPSEPPKKKTRTDAATSGLILNWQKLVAGPSTGPTLHSGRSASSSSSSALGKPVSSRDATPARKAPKPLSEGGGLL